MENKNSNSMKAASKETQTDNLDELIEKINNLEGQYDKIDQEMRETTLEALRVIVKKYDKKLEKIVFPDIYYMDDDCYGEMVAVEALYLDENSNVCLDLDAPGGKGFDAKWIPSGELEDFLGNLMSELD